MAATPIGNLGDASPRLVEALITAKFIAAEDTRNLISLARSLKIRVEAKIFSLHEHNESERLSQLVELATENDVLVVSDAGMPTVSDPGFLLVRAAVAAGIEVTIIPGPSAVLSALAVSGLPTDRFSFEGFLPRKDGERRRLFESLASESRTMVFFESPHRLVDSLKIAREVLGADRQGNISRELTKKFEQTVRGGLGELVDFAMTDPKGEFVIVIAGAAPAEVVATDLVASVNELVAGGLQLKPAVAQVASQHGASKSELYQLVLDSRKA